MPIFISYSHKDKKFVDQLAMQLVHQNVHIWLDRWELSVGDSIIDKIQEAADGASALLVILSKASVESEWCKKELSAGFLRELEEKRVVVLPIMLEDCAVPLFARGKMYADFRSDFDEGLTAVVDGIAKVTSPSLGRFKEPEYHTDWSIDYGDVDGRVAIVLNYVQIPLNQPYTCLTRIDIFGSVVASSIFEKEKQASGVDRAKLYVLGLLSDTLIAKGGLKPRLADEREQVYQFEIKGSSSGEEYSVRIGARRIGENTGRDVLVNTSGIISETYRHMKEVLKTPKSAR
jgi:hypothetical protein